MHFFTFSFDLAGSTNDLQNPLVVEDVPYDSSVLHLKLIIQDMTAINVARQSIHYSGQLLEDHLTVRHYIPTRDEDDTTIVTATLEIAPENYKVAVVVIPSSIIQNGGPASPTKVRVRHNSSVRELKDKICRRMGYYDVEMTSNGVRMEDDSSSLSEFDIKEGSEVYIQQPANVGPR